MKCSPSNSEPVVVHYEIWRNTLDFDTRLPQLIKAGKPDRLLQILTPNQEGVETYRIVRDSAGQNKLSHVGGIIPTAHTDWSDPSRKYELMRDSE